MLDVLKSYPACDNSLMRVFKVFMLESNTLGFSIICEALIFFFYKAVYFIIKLFL